MWYSNRADNTGNSKDYEHRYCKLVFGCPILERDDALFAEIFNDTIRHLDFERQVRAMRAIDVTKLFTVKQFTEYLHEVEQDCIANEIPIVHPSDLYYLAMGR